MSFQDVGHFSGSRSNNRSSFSPIKTSTLSSKLSPTSGARMRRDHPPKLPRVKAMPTTPSSSTGTTPTNTSKMRQNYRGLSMERQKKYHAIHDDVDINRTNINNNKTHRKSSSSSSLSSSKKKSFLKHTYNDLLDSYEENDDDVQVSKSSTESSVDDDDGCDKESRDDYESFGPDRSQQQHQRSITKKKNRQSKLRDSTGNKYGIKSSVFSKLTHEMQQYQKMVSDLERMIQGTIVTPEVAWKTNILVKSVEEMDMDLYHRIVDYENTTMKRNAHFTQNKPNNNACIKLRRDYNRCHNAMISCIEIHQTRQKAEISQLGAVQWSTDRNNVGTSSVGNGIKSSQINDEEDFFDRMMRQKELERMNESMRKVNDIYQGLAGLVEGQQRSIDRMVENVDESKSNVRWAYDEFGCYADRQSSFTTLCGFDLATTQEDQLYELDQPKSLVPPPDGLRINENFYLSMPFETMKEDFQSVQEDMVGLGNCLLDHCQRLDCCCNDD